MPGIQNSTKTLKWLGGVGTTDKGDQVSLNHVATVLLEMGTFLIEKATDNLDKKGHTASGKTISSMRIVNVQTNATKASLDVEILSTYKFLNEGVKGVESGTGKYKFKNKYPNKKMASAIKSWLRVRRIATKYKAISRNERVNQGVKRMVQSADGKLTGLSYAIATNIKKHGIEPTYFFSGKPYSAVEATIKEQKKRYAAAFKLDIIETLNKN